MDEINRYDWFKPDKQEQGLVMPSKGELVYLCKVQAYKNLICMVFDRGIFRASRTSHIAPLNADMS